jgi:hypothetical protein
MSSWEWASAASMKLLFDPGAVSSLVRAVAVAVAVASGGARDAEFSGRWGRLPRGARGGGGEARYCSSDGKSVLPMSSLTLAIVLTRAQKPVSQSPAMAAAVIAPASSAKSSRWAVATPRYLPRIRGALTRLAMPWLQLNSMPPAVPALFISP